MPSNILSYSFTTYISPSISNSISVSAYSIIGEGDKITIKRETKKQDLIEIQLSKKQGKKTRFNWNWSWRKRQWTWKLSLC